MAGNLAGAGSEHRFTFTASTGQTVYYDALQADFDTVYVSLISPTGRLLSQGNSDSDQGPILLTETGTYTLVQDNWLFDETDFQFRLLDGANQPGLALDALVQQTLDPGLAAHLYQLQPTPGLRLFFDGSHTNSEAAWWSFHAPTGDYLSGNNLRGDLEAVPNLPGTHWLVISSQEPSPAPYSFRVIPGNHAPTLGDLEDRTVDEEVTLEFDALATDLESPNDILSFSLDPDAPDGATIDPLTGRFRWTPAEHHGPGEYPITVRVSDDGIPSLGDSRAMVIRVREINQSPTLNSVSDHTIHAGATVRLPILATDPDLPSNTLVYSLLEAPPGATLDPATGWFDWTSAVVDAGTTLPITVELSDDGLPPLSDTAAFVIAVADPLRLESIDFKDGQVTLHWQGIASHNYRVQYRDELGAQTWVDLPGDILSPGALTSKTDSTLDPGRDRYYRILDVP